MFSSINLNQTWTEKFKGKMSDSTNLSISIEGHEASEHEADSQQSGPVLKKLKKTILSSENVEKSEAEDDLDKFSDLPDSLIDHILSFMETKDAIRTAVLSKKWKDNWKSTSHLNLCSKPFRRLTEFRRFVTWVLSHHHSSEVKVLIYNRFGVGYGTDQSLMNKVMEYATSRGVEDVRINLRGRNSGTPPIQLPPCLCNCQSLKRLELDYCQTPNLLSRFNCKSLETLRIGHCLVFPSPYGRFEHIAELFNYTTLTSLHLNSFTVDYEGIDRVDPFADFINLKSLHLNQICFNSDSDLQEFVISAPKLNDLTLMCNHFDCKLVISAPKLTKFSYLHSNPYSFLEFGIPSLHDLMIDIREKHDGLEKSREKQGGESLHGLINMARGLDVAEAVKLCFRTIEVTCETAVLLDEEYPCSSTLKSLNLGAGSTYKVFIDNLDHVTVYFRNYSEQGDFKIVNI